MDSQATWPALALPDFLLKGARLSLEAEADTARQDTIASARTLYLAFEARLQASWAAVEVEVRRGKKRKRLSVELPGSVGRDGLREARQSIERGSQTDDPSDPQFSRNARLSTKSVQIDLEVFAQPVMAPVSSVSTTELTGLPTQAGQDTLTTTSDRRRSSSASVQVIEPPTVRSKPNESQTSTLVGSQNGSNAANGGIIKATTANRSAGGIDQSAVIQIAAESREGSSLHAEADTSMESVHTRVSSQATEATVHMEIDTQPLVTTETMAASQSEALSAELAPVQPSQLLSSMPGNAQRIFAADPALRNVSIASILPQSPVSAFISGNAKRASTTHGARASAFVAPMSVPRASQAEQRSERSGRTSSLSAVREQSSNSQIAASTFESAKSSTMPATAFYASSRASLQTGRRSVSVHSDGSVGTAIGPTTSTSRADAIRETMHRIKATRSSVAHQGASLSARPSYLVSSAPSTMTLYHESRTSLAPSTASAAPSTRTTLTSTMREPRLSDALSDQSISQTSISFETAPPTQTMNQSRPSSASSATSQPTRMQDSRPVTSMIPRLRQTSGSKTDAEIKAAKERRERQAEETRLADERSERERVEKERLELQRLDAERQKQQAAEKRQAKVAEEALQRAEEEARLKAEEEARQKEAAAEQAAREAEKRAKAKREAQERERERQAAAERKAEAERQAAKLRDEEERRLRLLELEKRKKERAEVNARLAERKEKEAAATAAAIARRKLEDEETRRQAVERAAEAEAKRKAAAARQPLANASNRPIPAPAFAQQMPPSLPSSAKLNKSLKGILPDKPMRTSNASTGPATSSKHVAPQSAQQQPEQYVELEEPASEYSDSDEEAAMLRDKKNPAWAQQDPLYDALLAQQNVNPDKIFDPDFQAQPVNLRELLGKDGIKAATRPRSSSMHWDGPDSLDAEEKARYNKKMGYGPKLASRLSKQL